MYVWRINRIEIVCLKNTYSRNNKFSYLRIISRQGYNLKNYAQNISIFDAIKPGSGNYNHL